MRETDDNTKLAVNESLSTLLQITTKDHNDNGHYWKTAVQRSNSRF
jgi:hypothetical protein